MLLPTLTLAAAALAQAPAPADIVITHARVFTDGAARPWAEGVSIRGERVLTVGTAAEVRKTAAEWCTTG